MTFILQITPRLYISSKEYTGPMKYMTAWPHDVSAHSAHEHINKIRLHMDTTDSPLVITSSMGRSKAPTMVMAYLILYENHNHRVLMKNMINIHPKLDISLVDGLILSELIGEDPFDVFQ